MPWQRIEATARRAVWRTLLAGSVLLAGCASEPPSPPLPPQPRPDDVRAQIVSMLPAGLADRKGWATDIYAALSALRIEPSTEHLCSVLAVTAQESSFRVDPAVPGLGRIAWQEIDRRAERAGVPRLLVHGALQLPSSDGRSYATRIDNAKTEKDLSNAFDDIIGTVPLGRRLFAGYNPVHTAGPMQVSIDFAQRQIERRPYPYPMTGSVRDEVFTRRGGLYFGIAHLLDYAAGYDRPIYRFADFNAGRYASRNAAFQSAVSTASGIPLELDGDLVRHDGDGDRDRPGNTELAVRTLAGRLGLGDGDVRTALEQEAEPSFAQTRLYARVFELAEQLERRTLPRAVVPQIKLQSPKISRQLTTDWFAHRVDSRFQRCMAQPS